MTLLHGNMGTESQREDGFPVVARRFKVARKDDNVIFASNVIAGSELDWDIVEKLLVL